MKHPVTLILVLAAVCFYTAAEFATAQSAQNSEPPQAGVVLTKLFEPTYPPLARQARITGDVEVTVRVRQDGSVESAALVSGHPMLAPFALESVKNSQFECRGCTEAAVSYVLKYKFQIIPRGYPKDCDMQTEKRPPAEVDLSHHQVRVSSWAMEICDPAARILKVRSAKCLYLWRCSTRYEL